MTRDSDEGVWGDPDEDVGVDQPVAPAARGLRPAVAGACAVLVIVVGVVMTRAGGPAGDDLPVERVTAPALAEKVDAVAPPDFGRRASFQSLEEARILLALASAEIAAVRDVAAQIDVPSQRLRILADQTAGHLAAITHLRREAAAERTSADELATAYRDSVDHDALVRSLLLIEVQARDLALLDAVHLTAVRGIRVIDLAAARPELERRLALGILSPDAASWAEALRAAMDGDPVDADATRDAALRQLPGLTAQLGGIPASEELRDYVGDLDDDVLRALRGERYFHGFLRYLVDPGATEPVPAPRAAPPR